jgi:tryptophanyl-tRNA synthetase
MMRPAISLQAEDEALYFIADYHALTSLRDPPLASTHLRVALVPHLRLDRTGRTLSPIRLPLGSWPGPPSHRGLLGGRIPTRTRSRVGFPPRPVFAIGLMAADFDCDSDVVPVGRDQKRHLERRAISRSR